MFTRSFQRTMLLAIAAGALAATALAQIPVPPPPPLPGLQIHITTGRPPVVRYETRPLRPGPDYIWVSGFWADQGGRWEWVPGRWEIPVDTGAYWIPPRYIRTEGGYIYEPGHWSTQTLIVEENVRGHRGWKKHLRKHELELERERERRYYERD